MLSIQTSSNADRSTVNILPCRIHHNGSAKVTKRHWTPTTDAAGSKTAYFRGRKLKGKELKLPAGYTGLVTKPTERTLPKKYLSTNEDDSDVEEEQDSEPVKVLESVSEFKDITVWGHDQMPTTEDSFVKGVEEWISFAHAIHSNPQTNEETRPH